MEILKKAEIQNDIITSNNIIISKSTKILVLYYLLRDILNMLKKTEFNISMYI